MKTSFQLNGSIRPFGQQAEILLSTDSKEHYVAPDGCDARELVGGPVQNADGKTVGVIVAASSDSSGNTRATVRFLDNQHGGKAKNLVDSGKIHETRILAKATNYRSTAAGNLINQWKPLSVVLLQNEKSGTVAATINNHEEKPMNQTAKSSATESLQQIIDAGKRAVGYSDHGSIENPIRTQNAAATAGFLDLREYRMDAMEQLHNHRALLAGTEAGRCYDASALIAEYSRCAPAGAKVIVAADPPAATTGDVIVFQRDAGSFDTIEAGKFSQVVDGEDVQDTSLSEFIKSAPISWPDAPSAAWSTKITRADQRGKGYDVAQAAMHSILLGLANEADRVLLSAILAARTGEVFTLRVAAQQGLKWSELRAICGAPNSGNYDGLIKIDSGKLYYKDVPAELTDVVNAEIIGAFNRAAIAIHPIIRVAVKRLNVNGDLEMTVFANLLPLIPRPEVFWI